MLYKINLDNFKISSEENKKPHECFYDKTFVPCKKYFNLLNDYINKRFKISSDIIKMIYNYLVDSVYVTDNGKIDIRSCK